MSGPVAVVADFVVVAFALVLGVRLFLAGRRAVEASKMVFAGGLLSMALAAVSTGIAHGLVRRLGGSGLDAVWRLGALAVGLASFCFVAGVALACSKGRWRRLLLGLAAVKLLLFSFWTLSQASPNVVVWELSSALAVVVVFEGWAWISRRARSAPYVIAGAAAALVALAVQPTGIVVHSNLDHDLIYYLLLLAGLWLLSSGGQRLHDWIS